MIQEFLLIFLNDECNFPEFHFLHLDVQRTMHLLRN